MSDTNRLIVRRWFEEVWNQGRESVIDDLFAPEGLAHGLGETGVPVCGPNEFKPFFHALRNSFPDIRITVQDEIVEGDKIAIRVELTGTHAGEGIGLPPSGKQVKVSGNIILRIADGQIQEGWNSWDQLGLLRQIGAFPAPQPEPRFLSKKV